MPLPKPNEGEAQKDFISRCVAAESHASPDMDNKQVVAMCYTQWRNAKAGKLSEEDMNTVEQYAFLGDSKEYKNLFSKKKGLMKWEKEILRFGTWRHPENREIEFSITPDVCKQIVENFESGIPYEAPVTLTHTDDPSQKAGRVQRFVVTPRGLSAILLIHEDKINEKIELGTDTAPGVSCWLDLNYRTKEDNAPVGAVVKHVALVNHPYIEGMEGFKAVLSAMAEDERSFLPLRLSEETNLSEDESMEITKEVAISTLKEKFNLDVAALLSSAEELSALHDRIDKGELVTQADVTTFLSEEVVKKAKEQLKLGEGDKLEIKSAVSTLSEKVAELTTALSASESKLSEANKKLLEADADKVLSALLSEGRLLPKEKPAMLKLALSDRVTFDEMVVARKESTPLLKLGEIGTSQGESVEDADAAKKVLERNIEKAKAEGHIKG